MKSKKLNAQSVDTSLKLARVSYKAAKYAVEKWHYSRAMPSGKLIKYGVWEDSKFIGVIIFERGANPTMALK